MTSPVLQRGLSPCLTARSGRWVQRGAADRAWFLGSLGLKQGTQGSGARRPPLRLQVHGATPVQAGVSSRRPDRHVFPVLLRLHFFNIPQVGTALVTVWAHSLTNGVTKQAWRKMLSFIFVFWFYVKQWLCFKNRYTTKLILIYYIYYYHYVISLICAKVWQEEAGQTVFIDVGAHVKVHLNCAELTAAPARTQTSCPSGCDLTSPESQRGSSETGSSSGQKTPWWSFKQQLQGGDTSLTTCGKESHSLLCSHLKWHNYDDRNMTSKWDKSHA